MTTEDNPKAFPCEYRDSFEGNISGVEQGMTLRDYFAAKAMQGILSNSELYGIIAQKAKDDETTSQKINAALSYSTADAMLRERNR